MKNENTPNFPLDGKNEVQSSSKKRKENPYDLLEERTKAELLVEARNNGIKGRNQMRKGDLIHAIRNNLK